ncbi:MAG: nucleotidyl transferase AbiEii/AbiGii toxin family protein [Candidatus Methanoperedens sp.]|nr:nucleotidyl transferase AbiEii/AbiGii toxin family protein [Candidatus Methanoperedens sp.]
MLTRKQIEKIALMNRVTLFIQERDYIQAAYLSLLYSKTMSFVFKGGTCLRMAYGSPRYSEDLDFNSTLDENEAYSALETAAKELEYFGIRAEVRNKRMSRSGFGFTLSYRGPLYEGRDITKGLVRIDVSLRGESVSEDRITVRTEYDDVKTFIISAASLDHIFAEKVRALLVRGKARDLFDLWFLMERGIKPDLELINSKLSLYNKTYSQEEMNKRIAELEKSWTKDLKPLLGAVVPYAAAAKRVVDGLS